MVWSKKVSHPLLFNPKLTRVSNHLFSAEANTFKPSKLVTSNSPSPTHCLYQNKIIVPFPYPKQSRKQNYCIIIHSDLSRNNIINSESNEIFGKFKQNEKKEKNNKRLRRLKQI